MMQLRGFLILMGMLATLLFGETPPDGWVLFPINERALYCGNHSQHEWEVALKDKHITVGPVSRDNKPVLPFKIDMSTFAVWDGFHFGGEGKRHIQKVDDGWLVGFDRGEWGGGLWWFSSDGQTRKKLADENVAGLTKVAAQSIVFTGLAHLGGDRGGVLRVKRDGVSWQAEALADLGSAPATFAVESPKSVLVITTKGLVRVRVTGAIENLFRTKYDGLYPNSMTLSDDGVIHVGMRHFVTRLTPTRTGYKEEWFVPKNCQRFEMQTSGCVCKGASGK